MPKLEKNLEYNQDSGELSDNSKLNSEFTDLLYNQQSKEEVRKHFRNALWGIDLLVKEGEVDSETTTDELLQAIDDRKREIQATHSYSTYTKRRPLNETGEELHQLADEEYETSSRLLGYLVAAEDAIEVLIETRMIRSDSPLDLVRSFIKQRSDEEESRVDKDEMDRRKK